jgi:hypothetical protein
MRGDAVNPTENEEALEEAKNAAVRVFAQQLGVSQVESGITRVGTKPFLHLKVGRAAPVYEKALRETYKRLPHESLFRGRTVLDYVKPDSFPKSFESDVLLGLLGRSTKTIARQDAPGINVPFVPFQNREDELIIQPATHLIWGRRGVGKSTLIMRAVELLRETGSPCAVMDMQRYEQRTDEKLVTDILADVAEAFARAAEEVDAPVERVADFRRFSEGILEGTVSTGRATVALHRIVTRFTSAIGKEVFLFFDDFHYIDEALQPVVLGDVYGSLKGAGAWLKVAGVKSLLNHYDPQRKRGLQIPGDAQSIPLDLTLVDPVTAANHLRAILETFLEFIGIKAMGAVLEEDAFRRLVWANAGVPRDFLQSLAGAIRHARRANRKRVVVTDVNLAIGEFGQQKLSDMERDAQNEKNVLRLVLETIEAFCFDDKKINAFLFRHGVDIPHRLIQTLSDLRLIHVLHQTITPHKAGERFEAYMLDYSLFTGFRRRPGVKEMRPTDGKQFKVTELRKIPILPTDRIEKVLQDAGGA